MSTKHEFAIGPYYSDSHIRGARYQIIAPSGEPFVARIVAEVPDLDTARTIIARLNAYTPLAETARAFVDYLKGYCEAADDDDPGHEILRRTRALLRDLGEL